jgi:hypothetical protein
MAPRLKSVRRLLQDKPTLQRLDQELKAQKTLLTDLRQCLPTELADHCASAHIRENTLVVHTDSPAWATRLRYLAPQLVIAVAGEYPAVQSVSVRLIVQQRVSVPKPTARHSDRAAEIIHTSADCAKPGPVQDALRRLGDVLKNVKIPR